MELFEEEQEEEEQKKKKRMMMMTRRSKFSIPLERNRDHSVNVNCQN